MTLIESTVRDWKCDHCGLITEEKWSAEMPDPPQWWKVEYTPPLMHGKPKPLHFCSDACFRSWHNRMADGAASGEMRAAGRPSLIATGYLRVDSRPVGSNIMVGDDLLDDLIRDHLRCVRVDGHTSGYGRVRLTVEPLA